MFPTIRKIRLFLKLSLSDNKSMVYKLKLIEVYGTDYSKYLMEKVSEALSIKLIQTVPSLF